MPLNSLLSGHNRTQIIKKNVVGSFIIKGISIAISLVLVPMTLGYVSSEIYGVWLTLSSILHWLNYMDVGFTLGLKNRLAEALAEENYAKGKSLVSTTYFMMVIIFIPLTILLFTYSPYINWCSLMNISPIYSKDVLHTIQLLFIFVALQMIFNVLVAVVAAYQKVAFSSLFNVVGQAGALIVIFLMTKFVPPSLPYLTLAFSLMPILVICTFSIFLYRGRFKKVAPTFKSVNLTYIRDLWSLGARFFIIQVQMIILYQTTNILISNMDGPDAVTQYNIAYKVLNVVIMIFTIILNPLWPAFTDAYTRNEYTWMNRVYHKMTLVFLGVSAIIIIIVLFSPFIFHLWIGNKVSIPFPLTISIAVYTIIYCWDSFQVNLINGVGAIKLQTYVTLIGLVLHIPLSIFLGRQIGTYGVLASMCIINTIYALFFTIQIHKILKKKAKGIWIE